MTIKNFIAMFVELNYQILQIHTDRQLPVADLLINVIML